MVEGIQINIAVKVFKSTPC